MNKQVVVSDVTIKSSEILKQAKGILTERVEANGGVDEDCGSFESIAEALGLAWIDYLDDILSGTIPIPKRLMRGVEKHEKYFERWGI